jgi:hypothetical protein
MDGVDVGDLDGDLRDHRRRRILAHDAELVSMRAAGWNVERLDAASMTAMEASRTAVLVCQGRAAADGRIAVGRFADPVAITMLRHGERIPVDQVRAGTPPAGWAERVDYEAVRAPS